MEEGKERILETRIRKEGKYEGRKEPQGDRRQKVV